MNSEDLFFSVNKKVFSFGCNLLFLSVNEQVGMGIEPVTFYPFHKA